MSGKSQAGHVDNYDDPLPCPLTTRNLCPRLTKSLARSVYRNPQVPLAGPSSQPTSHTTTNLPVMQSSAGPSSSGSKPGPLIEDRDPGSSQHAKRKRNRGAKRRRKLASAAYVDQQDTRAVGDSHLRMGDTQPSAGTSSSSGSAGSSSRIHPSESPYASVSSPSLRKILHPSNIGFSQRSFPISGPVASTSAAAAVNPSDPLPPEAEPLADYTCPICFFPPTNATLTPCGHICCGSCLFMAVKSTVERGMYTMGEANSPRCPVCRSPIPGWDGKGGGVIGLKPRALFSL